MLVCVIYSARSQSTHSMLLPRALCDIGMAVVFFPAALDGTLDPLLLHAAEPAVDTKWVSQIWIRQSTYNGAPTARIPRI